MAPEDSDPQGHEDEASEPQAPQDAAYWKRKAEEYDRKLKRERAVTDAIAENPGVKREDLKGIDPNEIGRLAPLIAAARQTPSPEATKSSESDETSSTTKEIPGEVKEAQKAFNAVAGGNAPPIDTSEPLPGPVEARKRVKDGVWSEQQYGAYLEQKHGKK